MSEQPAGRPVEPEAAWWRSRRVAWPVGAVVALVLVGALSSGLFPDSTVASLVTGMAWSLAWLTVLVLAVGYGSAWVRGLGK